MVMFMVSSFAQQSQSKVARARPVLLLTSLKVDLKLGYIVKEKDYKLSR